MTAAINVIKIGGSLSEKPKALQALCQKLSQIAGKHQIVIIPGGGKFADCVREADKQFSLSEVTTHHMAILGMDQYGLLLANLMTTNSQIVNSLKKAKKNRTGIITVFLPTKYITLKKEKNEEETLPESWDVTSDSIAAYIANKLKAKKVLLIKDVDGLFTEDPKQKKQAKLCEHLTTKELLEIKNATCTDTYLPKLLNTFKMDCHIINGFYPDRIEAALNKQKTIGTIISPHQTTNTTNIR